MNNIFYRPFLNMDSRALAKVWNESSYLSLYGHEISENKFDELVLSNLFFDPRHLIVAVDPTSRAVPSHSAAVNTAFSLSDGEIIGFVHGGFGPNKTGTGPDQSVGYIAQLVVKNRDDQDEIREKLLHEMEKTFAQMGISHIYAGSVYPNAPFYSSVIQGCELNGILEKDPHLPKLLTQNGYVLVGTHHIFRFRVRRRIELDFYDELRIQDELDLIYPDQYETDDYEHLIQTTCWENCFYSQMWQKRFILVERATRTPIAWVGIRRLKETFASSHFGLHQLFVKEEHRQKGNAKLLLKLVLNEIQRQYPNPTVELQIPAVNLPALHTFSGLDFNLTSTGNVYARKFSEAVNDDSLQNSVSDEN
ncbi:MAG: hypothetical protein IJF17_07155 [Thermoguttaceae bacterium]|nr:hypothetical protein [Thermoguttaceae bacterium]MDO4426262.1 hypothetical protein [Planctomycetia bacterium]